MPELPEIETIKRALNNHLPGKRIERVWVREPRLRWPVQEKNLKKLVEGQQIHEIFRRAKYLLVRFKNGNTLIIHLGMSGKLLMLTDSNPLDKHDHVIFYFENQSQLRFRDPRRFGLIDAVLPEMVETYPRFVKLGFEPLASETSADLLYDKARNFKRPIKNLLMDAGFIVGVGNIYANEALFYAKIYPNLPAKQLSLKEWQKLLDKLRHVLNMAIQKGGTTLNDFVNSDGEIGYFQLSLTVYGRVGENCTECNSKIERYVLGGRSTYFCPDCQPIDEQSGDI